MSPTNELTWKNVDNTSRFGNLADGRPFFVGDFAGAGKADILFYYPEDHNWWLGQLSPTNELTWKNVDNTSRFGNLADGRPFFVGDFAGD